MLRRRLLHHQVTTANIQLKRDANRLSMTERRVLESIHEVLVLQIGKVVERPGVHAILLLRLLEFARTPRLLQRSIDYVRGFPGALTRGGVLLVQVCEVKCRDPAAMEEVRSKLCALVDVYHSQCENGEEDPANKAMSIP